MKKKFLAWLAVFAMVLSLGHDLQRRVSSGQLFEVDDLLERYRSEGAIPRFEKRCAAYFNSSPEVTAPVRSALYGLFDELEVLKEDFPEYRKKRLAGEGEVPKSEISEEEAICLEQLMVYFIYTYFCGSVYDEQAYEMVGRDTGMKYKLGQTVQVQVESTDKFLRTIDFMIAEDMEEKM